jgi:outer membrane protein assembly factor BamE (lipoprotein component of BamABCDE complex)
MAVREMSVRDVVLLLGAMALLLGSIIFALAFAIHRNSRLASDFDRVHAGMTDKEVLSVLGKPSWIEPCGKSFGRLRADCTEYVYRNSFAPFDPQYWTVSFDNDRQVVNTFVYSSP